MKKEFKEKFPQWVNENGNYVVCMSDDLDSLLSATLLKQVKGYEVKHFYDFNDFYSQDKDKRKAIGVDIALEQGMTWDNHVVRLSKNDTANPLSANPNIIENISRENYTSKYAMSTALLIWSYYGLELPKTDEGKLLLLSVDSSYKGHYTGFEKVQNEWLRKLGFEELIDIQNTYTLKDFANIKKKYNSSMKIVINNDGTLSTYMDLKGISNALGIDIELPAIQFHLRKRFNERSQINSNKYRTKSSVEEIHDKEIFALALTSKNNISLTFK
ncbi:hypothetical protein J7J00_17775 [Bacillus sp. ISL-4]|uniref:hypothetical protein n=1 Tax=Bacillus sp. ISL-4 TaxID=2819125 RepID=UPI001BE6678B|nr:hypothetical protein [Bacillus sp. ISL-4]MBT2667329.1 hypothetical protein [Bacillus sp. ISL-4]MBT2669435.1 hypothetical protein [Streptomyces sp. ISL-14]